MYWWVYKNMKREVHYKRKLYTGLIVSLFILIIIFYLFPKFDRKAELPEINHVTEITVVEIPRTVQKRRKRLLKPFKPVIPVAADETEMLDEVTIETDSVRALQLPHLTGDAFSSDDLPYLPRQVLEVLPKKAPGVYGTIVLSLKIDIDGAVVDYKIKKNTTGSAECLKNVLQAARKSRWEPVLFENQKVRYWIDKSYIFEKNQ